jgi:translation initiation factor RLI1
VALPLCRPACALSRLGTPFSIPSPPPLLVLLPHNCCTAAPLPPNQVLDRNVENLSGGELQRFAIAVVAAQEADVYMIDEPSSYLDVRQRLKAAEVIRSLLAPDKFVIVVEHDLSVLDYLSDFICCLYGKPGAYGVVTLPFSVREGINIFLAGFVPTENLRFREEALTFKVGAGAGPLECVLCCGCIV